MKRLVVGLGLAVVLCITGTTWAAEPQVSSQGMDLQQLEAAIFQTPRPRPVDHCFEGISCVRSFCLCNEACFDCGGIKTFTCNPTFCECNVPNCP
jgi:hypothetical protein